MVQQFLRAQPFEQHRRVVGEQYFPQLGIHPRLCIGAPLGYRQQTQVVVAKRDNTLFAQAVDQPQRVQ